MKFEKMDRKKGVAGLEVLLGVVASLFVIGVIVMAFVLAAAELEAATTDTDAIAVINDTGNSIADVIDWFPTFIVISAIVVLIIMITIIYRTVGGSGVMGGGA